MRPAIPLQAPLPTLEKYAKGQDVSAKNAFPCDELVTFLLRVPRALGVCEVTLHWWEDGGAEHTLALGFVGMEGACDLYRTALSFSEICPQAGGLFFYQLSLTRGDEALWSDTSDNAQMALTGGRGRPFSLLLYQVDFAVPQRFLGRVIYHVFVDRFARGGQCARRTDAVYHECFDEELWQVPEAWGAPIPNNELYGGTLWGVLEKLDHLQALGVGVLYLSPIFRANSNHKYDTGDYEEVAPEFGGEAALSALLAACKKRDMLVILDGVFNHTGDDSKYFNRRGSYPTLGAYQSERSPYRAWYDFDGSAVGYACWWGIPILPKLRLEREEVRGYFLGEGGVVERYLGMGVDGWRLDVADELPNSFLEELRVLVKRKTGGNGVVFGEVWENAATKIAYGERRRYFQGAQLDSVMNYPLREGIVAFVRDRDAPALCRVLRELWSSYPTCVCHALMNLLSTHDTPRILTVLGGEGEAGRPPLALRDIRMSEAARATARRLLQLAAILQYTVFGIPSLYYGDEAGMEGYGDPLCRRPYPWGGEENSLLTFYKKLGKIRGENTVFADGEFEILLERPHALAFARDNTRQRVVVAVNRGEEELLLRLPRAATELLGGRHAAGEVRVPPDTGCIWRIDDV